MIAFDIETSGLYPEKNGVWQIGAVDLDNPQNTFLEESRIDDEDEITEEALKVTGKTEKELRDKKKQSQKEMIEHFFEWVKNVKIKNIISQCPQIIDYPLIAIKVRKYKLELPFHHRTFDLHSIAQARYYQINGKFLIKENKSDMGLSNVLKFCGLKDERIKLEDGKVVKEGKAHNALEDAKLTAECFSRLIYGKGIFEEYKKFKIPEYLK